MMPVQRAKKRLQSYVEDLQSKGRYTFTRDQALKELRLSSTAFQKTAKRLADKRKIFSPKRGFFVIVPPEHRLSGSPPPSWFIDDLMLVLKQSYCVSLLSAAALYGSAHQQPQEFQIITTASLRPIKIGRIKICFYRKQKMTNCFIKKMKTQTGFMNVAFPELTVFDLIRYAKSAGHISHVVSVIKGFVGQCRSNTLVEIIKNEEILTVGQRLGYILDFLGESKLAEAVFRVLATKQLLPTALRPDQSFTGAVLNSKWQVWLNEKLEVEE